jgi:patatin-related protein
MSSDLNNQSKLPKPSFSREHRLGLVVYGGVSLAIYMNGICQEFYNAVRGRGIYKLIKALTDADIVVDIISATSAGGINGVLLSYALANSQGKKYIDFNKFAKVWKDEGDINKLFFDLDNKDYRDAYKFSFFNGIDYKSKISKALSDCAVKDAPRDDWFSEFGELDLFVTGTDIQGKIYQVFDSTDCVIDVKDHQAIFHLKYRNYDLKNSPFKPKDKITCEALAKLCQITSCFPVAFPAVTVKLEPKDNDPDKKLVEWGKLNNRIVPEKTPQADKHKKNPKIDDDPGEGYRLHFVDGGVLDNRPFSYTIKEIYHRAADRPVFRKLFYIDPSPDRFAGNPKYDDMLKPDIVQVVQDSLLSMPGYESINNDLELINEHNDKVRRYKFLLVDLENLLDKEKPDIQNRDFYDQQKNVYLRTRLISLQDKILPLIFLKSEGLVKTKTIEREKNRTKNLEKVAKLLAEPFTNPQSSLERLKLLERLEEEIKNLDVDYALRRYFFITEYIYRLLDEDYLCEWIKNQKKQNIDEFIKNKIKQILNNLEALIKELNFHKRLLEIIKDKVDKLFIFEGIETYFFGLLEPPNQVPEKEFPEKFYRAMLWLHGQFLDVEFSLELRNKELLIKQLTENLDKKLQELKYPKVDLDKFFNESPEKQLKELGELSNKSVLKKLVNETQNLLSSHGDREIEHFNYIQEKLLMYFKEFEKLDTVLYPLDYFAGVPEKQLIETFRISPEDAKLGFSEKFEDGNRLDQKLAGDSLRAFGGFFKKSWRANDILWGRLDGLNRIVEALVTAEKIKSFEKLLERAAQEVNIAPHEYLDRLFKEALFPEFDPKFRSEEDNQYLADREDELKQKIKNLFPSVDVRSSDGKALEDEKKLQEEALEELVKTLVSVGHLFILDQEIEDTMKTSIEEQLNWKQQRQTLDKTKIIKNQDVNSNQDSKKTIQSVAAKSVDIQQESEPNKHSKKILDIPKFNPIDLSFDSAITALIVKQIAKESLGSMSLKEKEDFFKEDYKIGLQTWHHIPKSERKKIIVKAICIFEDIFTTWQQTSESRENKKPSNLTTVWNQVGFKIADRMIKSAIYVLKILVPILYL